MGRQLGGPPSCPNNAFAGRQVRRACLRQLTSKGGASARCCSVAPLGMAFTRRTFMASKWFYTRDAQGESDMASTTKATASALPPASGASAFVLSPEQEKVVNHRGGHLQVIACAGAG